MGEYIISASGTQYGLLINPDGSIKTSEGTALDTTTALKLEYSGTAIGSVWKFIGTGSYVQVLSYSGTNLTEVSAWTAV